MTAFVRSQVFGKVATRRLIALAVFGAGVAGVSPSSRAGDVVWTNDTDNFWNLSSGNWTTPSNGGIPWDNTANAGATFLSGGGSTITVSDSVIARSLDFQGSGYTLGYSGSGSINLTTAGASTYLTGVNPTATQAATGTYVNVFTGFGAHIDAPIVSASGMYKVGGGVLELGGSNSITGGTSIAAMGGTTGPFVDVLIGASAQNTNNAYNNAGTLRLTNPNALSPSVAVGIGAGFLDIGANNVTVGNLIFTNNSNSKTANGGVWQSVRDGNNGVIGSGQLTVTGEIDVIGQINSASSNSIGSDLNLNGSNVVIRPTVSAFSGGNTVLTIGGNISNGGIVVTYGYSLSGGFGAPDGITLAGNNTYTGPSVFNGGQDIIAGTNLTSSLRVVGSGGLFSGVYLSGSTGSILSASTIQVSDGGTFTVDNLTNVNTATSTSGPFIATTQNNNRLSDTATIELRDGSFVYKGAASNTAAGETFGSVLASGGRNGITITPGPAGAVTLTSTGSLTLGTGATLTISAGGAGVLGTTAKLLFNGGVPSAVGGIIPGLASSSDLLYYSPTNGITAVAAGSYATTLSAGGNVNLAASATVFSGTTVNAIKAAAAVNVGIQPGQKLNVTSGMILNTSTLAFMGPGTLAFGATPGISMGSGTLYVSAAMTGSAGFINSNGSTYLTGNMAGLSGGMFVDSGSIYLNTPTYTGPIQVRAGTLSIGVSQTGAAYGGITLGVPENDADLVTVATSPTISTSSAPANSVFAWPITVSNGGESAKGLTTVGRGNGYTSTLSVLSSSTGSQTFTGTITLNTSLSLSGSGGSGNFGTIFNGAIQGAGTFYAPNGRVAFNGAVTNAGGLLLGGQGYTMQAFFGGSGSGAVPLTMVGGNNTSVTYTTSSALPSGTLTFSGGTTSIIPIEANSVLANNVVVPSGSVAAFAPGLGNTLTLTGSITGGGLVTQSGLGRLILPNDPTVLLSVIAGTYYPTDARPLQNTVTVAGTGTIDLSLLSTSLARSSGQVIVTNGGLVTGNTITGTGTIGLNVAYNGSTTTYQPVIASTLSDGTTVSATGTVNYSPAIALSRNVALTLTGTNNYSGPTIVTNTVLRGVDGVNISPNSAVVLNGGVLEGSPTYNRTLGTGPGQIQILGAGSSYGGSSGFSAFGGPTSVTLDNGNTLVFGSSNFNPAALVLNGPAANGPITLNNALDLGGGTGTIAVYANVATIPNVIANGSLFKDQAGILVLTAPNTYGGATTISGGATSTLPGGGGIQAIDGVGLPSGSALVMQLGGVLQTSGTFGRSIGAGGGQVSFPSVSYGGSGVIGAGFDAVSGTTGAGLTIAMTGNVSTPNTIQLNSVSNQGSFNLTHLMLNTGAAANGPIVFADSIDLYGAKTSQYINSVQVGSGFVVNVGTGSGTGSAGTATLSGSIVDTSSTGAGIFTKWGPGELIVTGTMSSSNWASGSVVVSGGTLALAAGAYLNKNVTVTGSASSYGATFDPSAATSTYSVSPGQVLSVVGTNAYLGGNYTAATAGTISFSGGVANAVNTASNNFSGALNVSVSPTGILSLTGTNTYSGPTYVNGGTLRVDSPASFSPNSVLIMKSGTFLQSTGSFSLPLGTTAGSIQLTASATGSVGFDSYAPTPGSMLTVNLGGAGATVQMGSSTFALTTLNLDTTLTSNGPITFANGIDLNGKSATISVGTSSSTGINTATLTGALTNSTGTGILTKTGLGRLVIGTSPSAAWTTGSIVATGGTLALAGGVNLTRSVVLAGGNFDPTASASPFALAASQNLTIQNTTSVAVGSYAGTGTVTFNGTSAGQLLSSAAGLGGALSVNVTNSSTTTFGTTTLSGSLTTGGAITVAGNKNALVLQSAPASVTGSLSLTGSYVSAQFSVPTSTSTPTLAGQFASISVTNGNGAVYSPTGTVSIGQTNRATQKPSVLVTSGINLGTFGTSYSGFIDLGNNDLIAHGISESTVRSEVAAWYNGGSPATIGIGSTAPGAGTGLTTLAVVGNGVGGGATLYSSYDGVPVTAADTIVKYTYFGDTNLDGIVDASDLANALAGINGGLTGWINGDFNYDGAANGADLNLLLASLSGQSISYGNGDSTSGAVPEPSGVAVLALAVPMLSRRRRV